ncbi:MAG: hypothetical protein WDN07_05080 [Actinomycetota bacterium]
MRTGIQTVTQGGFTFQCIKKSNKLVWSSTPNFSAPYFQRSDIQYANPIYAPQQYIQIRIIWNGDDVNGQHFPRGTAAAIVMDGNLLSDQTAPAQSVTIVVSNAPHSIQLIVTNVGKSQLLSSPLQIGQEPLSSLPAAPALTSEVTLHLECTGSGELSGFILVGVVVQQRN